MGAVLELETPTAVRPSPAAPCHPSRLHSRSSSLAFDSILFDLGDTILHFETWRAKEFLAAGAGPVHARLCEWGFKPPRYKAYLSTLKRAFVTSFLWSRLVRRETDLLGDFRRLHCRLGIDITEEQMTELVFLAVPPIRKFFSVDPHAARVLARLSRAGLKLGVVSNTFFPGFAIDDVLRGEGLLEPFSVRVYSSDVGFMKPHARIFEAALSRMGVAPERTLFVGDRLDKDVKGSARVGMRTMWLARNGQRAGRARPDFIIRDLSEIPSVLQL